MSIVENIEREFFSISEGFFVKLHQREFDEGAADRALTTMQSIRFGCDHAENYRIIHLIWPLDDEFRMAINNGVEGDLEKYRKLFFDELFRLFMNDILFIESRKL